MSKPVSDTELIEIVAASYQVWKLPKLEAARVAWKVPAVRRTWERRFRESYDEYVERMKK